MVMGIVTASCDDDPLLASPSPSALLQKSANVQLHRDTSTRVYVHSGTPPRTPMRGGGGYEAELESSDDVVQKSPEIPDVSVSAWQASGDLPEERPTDYRDANLMIPPWPHQEGLLASYSASRRENTSQFGTGLSLEQEEEISRFLGSLSWQSQPRASWSAHEGGYINDIPCLPGDTHESNWLSRLPFPLSMSGPCTDHAMPTQVANSSDQDYEPANNIGDPNSGTNYHCSTVQNSDSPGKPLPSESGKYRMDFDEGPFLSDEMILQPCRLCKRCFRVDRLLVHEKVCSSRSRRPPVFESQTQRCSVMGGRWWSEEAPNSCSGGSSSSTLPVRSRSRSTSAAFAGPGLRQQSSSVNSGRVQQLKGSQNISGCSDRASVAKHRSASAPLQKDRRAMQGSTNDKAAEKRRPSFRTDGRLDRKHININSPLKNVSSTPPKNKGPSDLRVSNSRTQTSSHLRQTSVEGSRCDNKINYKGKNDHAVGRQDIGHQAKTEIRKEIMVDVDSNDCSLSLQQSSSGPEHLTPSPRGNAPQVFTPSPISVNPYTLSHNSSHKGVFDGQLSELSDLQKLPNLEKRGPSSASTRIEYVSAPAQDFSHCFATDSIESTWGEHSDPPLTGTQYRTSDAISGRCSFVYDYEVDFDTRSPDARDIGGGSFSRTVPHATFLPDTPTLPSLDRGMEIPKRAVDFISHRQHIEEHCDRYVMAGSPSGSHSCRDDSPHEFSDPDVLAGMMCDVKLLGAHVDRLISAQQRLFTNSLATEGAQGIENWSDSRKVNPCESPELSVSTEVVDENWPSQPYDPAKYSEAGKERYYLGGGQPARSNSSPPCARREDVEIHSMVDSLERQSALFHARIRQCSQRIAERQHMMSMTSSSAGDSGLISFSRMSSNA